MGLRPTKGHEDALWQIRLAGGSACPTGANVGQALPPANRRLQRSRRLTLKIHSSRSSLAGSIPIARCAGIQVATSPSSAIAKTTPASTSGSRGLA